MPKLINFLAFQFGWFACVLGGANGLPWLGTGIAVALVGWHLTRAEHPLPELLLVLSAAALGALFDSLLVMSGWITYPSGMLIANTAPHWIVALWMIFATTLNVSLAWLKRHLFIAAIFGAVGGPLAYLGGAKLGALSFTAPTPALMALAIGWAVCTPLLAVLARRYDGFVNRLEIGNGAEHA